MQRSGRELASLVDAIDDVLGGRTTRQLAQNPIIESLPIAPDLVTLDTRDFLIRFDGSLIADVGAGIGVTLGYKGCNDLIASFSVPTKSGDA